MRGSESILQPIRSLFDSVGSVCDVLSTSSHTIYEFRIVNADRGEIGTPLPLQTSDLYPVPDEYHLLTFLSLFNFSYSSKSSPHCMLQYARCCQKSESGIFSLIIAKLSPYNECVMTYFQRPIIRIAPTMLL